MKLYSFGPKLFGVNWKDETGEEHENYKNDEMGKGRIKLVGNDKRGQDENGEDNEIGESDENGEIGKNICFDETCEAIENNFA